MDSHVAHPVGLMAALAEIGTPNAKRLTPNAKLEDFICNVYDAEPNERLGEPHATKFFTVEQLKAEGVAGLYAISSEGCGHTNTSQTDEARAKVDRPDRIEGPELGCVPERNALGRREITASRPQPSLESEGGQDLQDSEIKEIPSILSKNSSGISAVQPS